MGEEEEQQTSDGLWDRPDEIESVERIRNYPMFSPPRVLLLTGDDLEQSPSLELSGFHFGFDAIKKCLNHLKLAIVLAEAMEAAMEDKETKLLKEVIGFLEKETRDRKLYKEGIAALAKEVVRKLFFTIALEKDVQGKFISLTLRILFLRLEEPMTFVTETQHMHAAAHLAHFSPMAVGMGLGTMGMNGQSSITMQKGGTHFSAQWCPPNLGPASFEGMDESTLQVFGHPGQGLAIASPQAQLSRGPPIYLAEGLNPNGTVAAAVEVPYSAPSSMSKDLMLNTPSHMLLHNTDAGTPMNQKSSQEYFLEEQRSVEIINPSMNENIHSRLQCMQLPLPPRSSLWPEALPNGGEIEAASIGGKVASADVSCTATKKKNTTETPKRKRPTRRPVTLEDLQRLNGLNRADAAKSLDVSVSKFKRACRQNGIPWWNGDECSPLEPKLVFNSVHENSPPEPQGVKTTLPSCKEGSIGPQAEIGNPMLESRLSAQEGRLQGRFGARNVTIKANYRKDIVRFQLSYASGIVELKEKVAERLELKLGSFNVKYQDEDQDWILIGCDADLHACVKFSSSSSNQPIRLEVTDKDTPAKAAED